MSSPNPHIQALQSAQASDLFHGVTHHHQVWLPDPFDIDLIHQQARDVYTQLLHRASSPNGADSGRILLLLGDSGAGKTHLMRAFRNQTHQQNLGYFAYMQMTTESDNYARYVLRYTIDSLDKPYYTPWGTGTALMRLSDSLIEHRQIPPKVREILRDDQKPIKGRIELVYRIADHLLKHSNLQHIDLDLLRAFLLLQLRDPAINARVFKLLRCETLATYDQNLLGGLPSKDAQEDPPRMLYALGQLIRALNAGALVICLDQLEDIQKMQDADRRFRDAMSRAVSLAEIPNVVVVLSCLTDFYTLLQNNLIRTHIDRIERDPAPVKLNAERSADEIALLIARRLEDFWDRQNIASDPQQPLFPFSHALPQQLAGLRTRDVLEHCRNLLQDSPTPNTPTPTTLLPCDQKWNDHRAQAHEIPHEDEALLALLRVAIEQCAEELPGGYLFKVKPHGERLRVDICAANGQIVQALCIQLCQKPASGGALQKQIDELYAQATQKQTVGTAQQLGMALEHAGPRIAVAVRSSEFPSNPKTQIAKRLGQFIAQGGRRVVVENSDWREMVALQSFRQQYAQHDCFATWLQTEKPLSHLPSLQAMLDLASLSVAPPPSEHTAPPAPAVAPTPSPQPPPTTHNTASPPATSVPGTLYLGMSAEYQPKALQLPLESLVRHAAFLGGSGSGKTTLALNLIEQLLLQDIPVIFIDRKGDLCSYAKEQRWQAALAPERLAQREQLSQRIEVAVYTPGTLGSQGRGLSIPIAPAGLGELSSGERQQLAQLSAAALSGLLGYRQSNQDRHRTAMLGQAIAVLAELEPQRRLNLQCLMEFIDRQDPSLIQALGKLESKHLSKLVQDLQTLSFTNNSLFMAEAEPLCIESLLGRGQYQRPGRTRLSIISTAFLGNNDNLLFWVAQFLLELGRYASHHPASRLQAAVLLDEADLYLPAQSKPPTKEPLESLLRKARSAGLSLLLSTQSPGDLDYKGRDQIGTWFIGKIKEENAIRKLKPMLQDARTDISGKLAAQETGAFYWLDGTQVTALQAQRSLILAEQIPADEILHLAAASRTPAR
ncbi:ATP-binding protein [Thiorhodospira sibirica]|uniref:ATP-binding protein n=1 Tax=Thiorhodospira sibirica TaxID=154347 RepID=UPI00022C1CCE|nr:AAA family ATPase [Thiorhodospira sibirica]